MLTQKTLDRIINLGDFSEPNKVFTLLSWVDIDKVVDLDNLSDSEFIEQILDNIKEDVDDKTYSIAYKDIDEEHFIYTQDEADILVWNAQDSYTDEAKDDIPKRYHEYMNFDAYAEDQVASLYDLLDNVNEYYVEVLSDNTILAVDTFYVCD